VDQKVSLGLTVVPHIMMGFIIDDESYMHAVDLTEGKRKWRIALKAPAGKRFSMAARVQAEQIKKLVIPADSQDWVVWVSCGDSQICGYDPKLGIPLARFELGGSMTGIPMWHPEAHSFWVPFSKSGKGRIRL